MKITFHTALDGQVLSLVGCTEVASDFIIAEDCRNIRLAEYSTRVLN